MFKDNNDNLRTLNVSPRKFTKTTERPNSSPRKSFMSHFKTVRHKELARNATSGSTSDLPFALSPRKVFQREFNEYDREKVKARKAS